MSLNNLSNDAVANILKRLPADDVENFRRMNKQWKEVIEKEGLNRVEAMGLKITKGVKRTAEGKLKRMAKAKVWFGEDIKDEDTVWNLELEELVENSNVTLIEVIRKVFAKVKSFKCIQFEKITIDSEVFQVIMGSLVDLAAVEVAEFTSAVLQMTQEEFTTFVREMKPKELKMDSCTSEMSFVTDEIANLITDALVITAKNVTDCPELTNETLTKWSAAPIKNLNLENCKTNFTLPAISKAISQIQTNRTIVDWNFGTIEWNDEALDALIEMQRSQNNNQWNIGDAPHARKYTISQGSMGRAGGSFVWCM